MKLKLFFLCIILVMASLNANAQNNDLQQIRSRGYVACGTNTNNKALAYKDKDGEWSGIDANICKLFAIAVLGNEDAFEMVNIPSPKASNALKNGKIDFMLGNNALSANQEISSSMSIVDILYFDKQILASRHKPETNSMESFKGSKVCVVSQSFEEENLNEYNQRYVMKFKIIPFPDENAAKNAFYLGRCPLISNGEINLHHVKNSLVAKNNDITLLPEVISERPIYVYCDKNKTHLRIMGKWILNAIKLAEQYGINSKNIESFIGIKSKSIKNLLGINQELWNKFGINPNWLKQALPIIGNYGEFYDRNLGYDSELKISREKNKLLKDGGYIATSPFI